MFATMHTLVCLKDGPAERLRRQLGTLLVWFGVFLFFNKQHTEGHVSHLKTLHKALPQRKRGLF